MTIHQQLRNFLKRFLDIIGAFVGIVLLAPVFAAVWLTVRIKLGSPVIFAQQRPGKDGRIFTLYKFRSMLAEDPARGLVTDDQRNTVFGRRLRATSLDELPTLLNVFKGDMSLVGPRPLLVEYVSRYTQHQARRHEARPGITGLAQVNGRNLLSWEERFDLDVEYVDRHNLLMDAKIMAQTISRVFAKSGVEGDGTTTMTTFVGAAPQDGLTEQVMTEQWQGLRETWQRDPQTIKIGWIGTEQRDDTRYWVYLNAEHTPIGIGGLSGLGGLHLDANIVISADHHDTHVSQALLNRLIHHGKSFDAEQITLHIPAQHGGLHRKVQRLGFVAADNLVAPDNGSQPSDSAYSLAVAPETAA